MGIPHMPTDQAVRYLRRIVSADPEVFGTNGPATVVNVEIIPDTGEDKGVMVLDLDDGTSIRLDVERYTR